MPVIGLTVPYCFINMAAPPSTAAQIESQWAFSAKLSSAKNTINSLISGGEKNRNNIDSAPKNINKPSLSFISMPAIEVVGASIKNVMTRLVKQCKTVGNIISGWLPAWHPPHHLLYTKSGKDNTPPAGTHSPLGPKTPQFAQAGGAASNAGSAMTQIEPIGNPQAENLISEVVYDALAVLNLLADRLPKDRQLREIWANQEIITYIGKLMNQGVDQLLQERDIFNLYCQSTESLVKNMPGKRELIDALIASQPYLSNLFGPVAHPEQLANPSIYQTAFGYLCQRGRRIDYPHLSAVSDWAYRFMFKDQLSPEAIRRHTRDYLQAVKQQLLDKPGGAGISPRQHSDVDAIPARPPRGRKSQSCSF